MTECIWYWKKKCSSKGGGDECLLALNRPIKNEEMGAIHAFFDSLLQGSHFPNYHLSQSPLDLFTIHSLVKPQYLAT